MTAIDDNQKDIITKAVQDFVDAQLQGFEPDIEEFVKQYPGLEHLIKQGIKDMQRINTLFDSLVQADESDFYDAPAGQNLVGKKIGGFEITEVIGSGGMGIVYLALDTRLDRLVAIKSIPVKQKESSTAKMRFKREAKLLASLNHPNIAVIYDIIETDDGDDYLVLEYVPGKTLAELITDKPLKLKQALSIARQIADAVSAAHKSGIIHRDLKPANIKITPDGSVKVLDFGLAKVPQDISKTGQITATEPGRIIGTPAYMSPEQARGKDIDYRTDIWSFGCILYEMLTGKFPFEGQTATDTLARIIERQPDWQLLPESTPVNIRVMLRRCLEKEPDRRLGNIADAAVEITDTMSKSATATVKSKPVKHRKVAIVIGASAVCILLFVIALKFIPKNKIQTSQKEIRLVVLPFENLGPADDEWFVDGMTDELTSRLAGIHGLAVISRQSAIQYKNKQTSTSQIAEDLKVDYILEGTIQREKPSDPNSRIRIRCQLIRTIDDTHLWAQNYDNNMSEIFGLQSQVAEQVAQHLDIMLLKQERTWSKYIPTNSTEAYNLVLQGKAAEAAGTYHDAIPFYEKAIEHDPNYVKALGEFAWAHMAIYWLEDPNPERLIKAEVSARRAFALLPDHPFVRLVMARYYYVGHLDFDRALEHLEKARELHPNHTWMLYWTHIVQERKGDFDQALVNIRRAFELDPLSAHFAWSLGITLRYLREYQEAEHYFELAIMRDPNRPDYYNQKAELYLLWQGDLSKARSVMEVGLKNIDKTKHPNPKYFNWWMITIDIWDGRYQDALDRLSKASEIPETSIWCAYNAFQYAEIYGHLNKTPLARQYYEYARNFMENKVAEHPDIAEYRSLLGLAYAGLGDKDKAVEHGKCGTDISPVTRDALDGQDRVEQLARIYVMVGKYELAIEQLEYLLSIPSRTSGQTLRLNPVWKPLHNHPSFQKLIESGK